MNKLEAITVAINYSDYLELTLPENVSYFDNYNVLTIKEDKETIDLCEKYKANCIIVDNPFGRNNFEFDKGYVIQQGLKNLKFFDWVLLLDADIILPLNFRKLVELNFPEANTLYGASRCFVWDYDEYLQYKNKEKKIDDFYRIEGGWGCGYFMLFHIRSNKIKKIPLNLLYPNGNIETDMILLEYFHPKRIDVGKLNFNVLHLGGPSLFWEGRFNGKERFDEIKNKKFKDLPNTKELLNL